MLTQYIPHHPNFNAELTGQKLHQMIVKTFQSVRQRGIPAQHLWHYSEKIFERFFYTFITINHLSQGNDLQNVGLIFDDTSANILSRSALENYLTFFYIYNDPHDDSETIQMRFNSWWRSGFCKRVNLFTQIPPIFDESRTELESDRRLISEVMTAIEQSAPFQRLIPAHQNSIRAGNWTLKKWGELIQMAGFNASYRNLIYHMLSGQAHSDSVAIMQHSQKTDTQRRDFFVTFTLPTFYVVTNFYIRGYLEFFGLKINDVLDNEELVFNDFYYSLGHDELDPEALARYKAENQKLHRRN